MAYARFELALGAALAAAGALATAAALAQAPAPTPPAPQYPPTATITTPGYPALGPADSKLRVTGPAERQEGAPAAGDARDHAVGLVRQRAAAGAARRFRRHRRPRDDDALAQPGGAGHAPSRRSRSCAPTSPAAARTRSPARSTSNGAEPGDVLKVTLEQDRAARLRDQLQRARHVRPVPHHYPDGQVQVHVPRPRQDGDGVPARRRSAAAAVPRNARRRAQGARPLQQRAAGRVRRQHGHPRFRRGHDALRAGACAGRAAVDRRLARRPGQRRGESHRDRDRVQGVQHHGRGAQGQDARLAAHRDAEVTGSPWAIDQDLNQAWDHGAGADGEVPRRAAQESPRRRRQR